MSMAGLPAGTVTFLLTDLVGSTKAWEASPASMREAMARHDRIVASRLGRHMGVEAGRAGDSVLAVFERAADGAACALELQRDFAEEGWPPGSDLKVRIALHTGEAELRRGQYYGLVLNRCARLLGTCHGGQVLITQATEQLLVDELPSRAALWDLGFHRLKDLTRPEHVFQLVDLDRPIEFPPIRSMQRRLSNLPAQLTPFIGREDELAQLHELHRRARLLTLTGPGGAGKTRLGLQLAAEVVGEHADGVWLVELDALSDPRLVPVAVAGGLGLKQQPGRRMADTLIDHFRDQNLLLILDNCEHVLDTAAELTEELLKGCEWVSVLATSREPLKVPGELTWRIPPLGSEEALRLFAERAQSRESRFRLTVDITEIVSRICQRLDRIPLAIELAAARVTVMPVDAILSHLESRFSLLTDGSRTTPNRQRTLKAAMDWSYDVLTEPEKILFRRVSIFAGRFSLGAAEAVCSDAKLPQSTVLNLIAQVVDKSLVTVEEGRYRCLETIRAYGRERLVESGELEPTQRNIGAYLHALAEARKPGQLAAWLDRLEAVSDDIPSTLRWSAQADPALGARLTLALALFWQLRGHAAEPRHYAKQLLERTPSGSPEHAALLQLAGAFAYSQADFTTARQLLNEALQEARIAGDRRTVVRALDTIGLLEAAQGEVVTSEAALEEGLTMAQELSFPEGEAGILQQLALLAGRRQDVREARSLFERSIQVRQSAGRPDENSMALTFLAAVALLEGDLEAARRCITEALEIGRALRDQRVAFSLDVLACLAALEGHAERAVQLGGAGSAMHEANGNTPPETWSQSVTRLLEPAREALGQETAKAAWEAGRRMDFDDAMEFALVGANKVEPVAPSQPTEGQVTTV